MKKLEEIIVAAKLSEEGVHNENKNEFVINSRNFSFLLSEKSDEIVLEIAYKNRLMKDVQELYAMKFAKINTILSIGGFSIDSLGKVSLYKIFSKYETTDNIAYATILFLQHSENFVIL